MDIILEFHAFAAWCRIIKRECLWGFFRVVRIDVNSQFMFRFDRK